MKKIYLNRKEKKELLSKGLLTIEREPYLARTSKSSIIHGIGTNHIWDKIERIWVFGDTKSYIESKKNYGRRLKDYPDNKRNNWSGAHWWECERDLNEYSIVCSNGRKEVITFIIEKMFISELKEDLEDSRYNRVTFSIIISLVS